MFITVLVALALISLCRNLQAPSEAREVIFVPYDVKFVPVQLDDSKLEKQPPDSTTKETATSQPEEVTADHKKSASFHLLHGQTEPSDDYILLPMSVLRALEDHAIEAGDLKQHLISKRQAPANGLNVYRPVVEFRSIIREKRRVFRSPPLVGYLNNYDRFPTVA